MANSAGPAGQEGQPRAKRAKILALHGSASNSNIIKFQLAQLRRLLGREAERLAPDGPEPWEPLPLTEDLIDPVQKMFFQERSPFEQRIAQGKPFVCWYGVDLTAECTMPNLASLTRACDWLEQYVGREGPFDAVVTHSQASTLVDLLTWRFADRGVEWPWSLNIFFSPSPILGNAWPWSKASRVPTFLVQSSDEIWAGMRAMEHREHFADLHVLEHQDGHAFPSTMPRAAELYQQLADEVRRHCGLARQDTELKKPRGGAWLARLAQAQAKAQPAHADEAAPRRPAAAAQIAEERDLGEVLPMEAEELAELLQVRGCALLSSSALARGAPALRTDLDLRTLQMLPDEAWPRLEQLRADGLCLVVTSLSGGSCEEYCSLLVRHFRFDAARLRLLRGGLYAWDSWELDHPTAADEIRRLHGLPPLPGSGLTALGPEELAELLREAGCVILDAREAAEMRQLPFPGAERGLSLLTLRSKPQLAKRKLEELREDGRRIVAVSATGGRCRRYCAVLAEQFGVEVGRLCWLRGGIFSWEVWQAENRDAADALQAAQGLPAARGRTATRSEEDRAAARMRSLELLSA